jgi:hypothetical protein
MSGLYRHFEILPSYVCTCGPPIEMKIVSRLGGDFDGVVHDSDSPANADRANNRECGQFHKLAEEETIRPHEPSS